MKKRPPHDLREYRDGLVTFLGKRATFSLYSDLPLPSGLHVILHHDLDKYIHMLPGFCDIERKLNIRSNIMVLRSRPKGQSHKIDWKIIKDLHDEGFLIGYHCNAYERSGFDIEEANKIFKDDILFMFDLGIQVKFYSAHGGAVGPDGLSDFDFVPECRDDFKLTSIDEIRFDMNIPAKWIEQSGIKIDRIARACGDISIRIGSHPQYWCWHE